MANEERNIDAMKYRKSTHLAGVDVEAIIAEKGKCVLTIKDAFYAKGVDVSGKKVDGYFISFVEPDIKPMMVNSGNRKIISANLKIMSKCTATESRNIGNWLGIQLDLYFDETVKMMGETVGGIKIRPLNPIQNIDTSAAILKLKESKTLAELQTKWGEITKDEKEHPFVLKTKDELKLTLK